MKMQQRSTKGASKQRRELINSEIIKIRDLLPAPETVRNHLSQLQVMSLCNMYISKCNFFESTLSSQGCYFDDLTSYVDPQYSDLSELLPGFLVMVTLEGKMLYLSENVIEYLGHSMVDILTHIDTVYDLIDSRDHKALRDALGGMRSGIHSQDEWSFTCRMGLTKKFHQNLGFYDQKSMIMRGFFMVPQFNHEMQKPVFVALCTPRLKAALASEPGVLFDTMVFESLHGLDMKYLEVNNNGEMHLGYSQDEIRSRSWHEFIHPEDSPRAVAAHKNILYCDSHTWSPLFVRMQRKDGRLIWMSILMKKVKNLSRDCKEAILCLNQVVREQDIIDECETGLVKSLFGRDFLSVAGLKGSDGSLGGNETDFAAKKCSGREEVLRRLKRKMEINEMKKMKAFLPSEDLSKSQCSSSSPKKSSVFTFDCPSMKTASPRSESAMMNMQRSSGNTSCQSDYFSYCPSERRDSSSCSSFSSVFHGSSSLTPSSLLSSPNSSGLSVMCEQDETDDFITTMPTPKFGNAGQYPDRDVFECGDQEEEEVVNIVEEMLEGRPFHDDSVKVRDFPKERQFCELPNLCPGIIADYFQEFDAATFPNESVLAMGSCFSPLEVHSILPAGQALADVIESRIPPVFSSCQNMGNNWPDSSMQDYLSGMEQSSTYDHTFHQNNNIAFTHDLDYDCMFQRAQDQRCFTNFLIAG